MLQSAFAWQPQFAWVDNASVDGAQAYDMAVCEGRTLFGLGAPWPIWCIKRHPTIA
jgi:hypothetical protein